MLNEKIQKLIERGALFCINHSGGKDSQAMYLMLRNLIPREQIVIIHANLGEVEWDGCIEHIQATTAGEEMYVVRNPNKTFLEMVERRGKWPSSQQRQCTSDLKRDPIDSKIKAILKQRGGKLIVNCMGMRAQESPKRSKLTVLSLSKRNSGTAGREWWNWYPIHKLTKDQVFAAIAEAGQKPHWAYAAGMTRLSCSFCIMASKSDLCIAAKLRPELYKKYVDLEEKINHTFINGQKLTDFTGIPAV